MSATPDAVAAPPAQRNGARSPAARSLAGYARWRWWELALFAALPLSWLLLPAQALLLNEIAIVALFAISLDLVLGYAGIVTLGHSAFFGIGAYAAGIFSIHVIGEPISGHLVAIVISAVFGLVTGAMILHTTGVTFLMLTLAIVSVVYEWANKAKWLTGGDDGL